MIRKRWLVLPLLLLAVGFLAYDADIPVAELEAKYAAAPSRFVEVQGARVHYRERGDGPALILLHGSSSSLFTWEAWAKELEQDFRVISLDLPAHGLTGPHPEHRYAPKDMAAFVADFAETLGVERYSLIGSSMGGGVAFRVAIQHPEKVEKLVLISPTGMPREEPLPLIFRGYTIPVIDLISANSTPGLAVEMALKDVYADDAKVSPALVQQYRDLGRRAGNRDAARIFFREPLHDELSGRLAEIKAPTLIMWGDQDIWVAPKYAKSFVDGIPQAKLITYPDLGHVPMEEAPAETLPDLLTFLRD